MMNAWHDARYALRGLGRSPGFAAVGVLTLAMGLGANTAMFSIVDHILLRPLAFPNAEQLYTVRTIVPGYGWNDAAVNGRHFHEWRLRCRSCDGIALLAGNGFTVTRAGDTERLPGLEVSFDFFRTLGVHPAIGRDFVAEDEGPGRSRVVILSDALWKRRFAADPSIVGRTISVNGELAEVVGVMGASLHLPRGDQWGRFFAHNREPEIFVPFRLSFETMSGGGMLNYAAVVRLHRSASPEAAAGEMTAALDDFRREFDTLVRARLIPLAEQVTADARAGLWLLMGAVAAVLLIVCVNIGNLMLVRSTSRYREVGIRLAVGATRGAVFRLVLAEVCVLVTAGALLGLWLAELGIRAFLATAPIDLPRLGEVAIDWRVFGFAGSLAVVCTLICGVFPAWRLSCAELQESLKTGTQSATEGRSRLHFRDVLVAVEVSASALLLIVGGLLIASLVEVMRIDTGFDRHHVLTIDVPITPQVPRYRDVDARNRFVEQALDRLRALPGVEAVGITTSLPLRGETPWVDDVVDADRAASASEPPMVGNYRFVSPDYWRAMGIALRDGRYFEETDRGRRVAVVSEQVAEQLWPNERAVGKRLRRGAEVNAQLSEIVGVVADVRADLEQHAPLTVYEPYWVLGPGGPSFVLRTMVEPMVVLPDVRAVFASLDSELPLHAPVTLDEIVAGATATRRFHTSLATAFAVSALLLAAVGLYGVISFSVARRTRELGLRSALGARPSQLLSLVVRQGLVPVAVGLIVGVGGAAVFGRVLSSQLYGVSPHDPLTFIVATIVLVGAATAACFVPARRAARIEPLIALRHE